MRSLADDIGCDHEWVPSDPMIEWKCVHCLTRRDGMPKDGPDVWAVVVRVLVRAAERFTRVVRWPS